MKINIAHGDADRLAVKVEWSEAADAEHVSLAKGPDGLLVITVAPRDMAPPTEDEADLEAAFQQLRDWIDEAHATEGPEAPADVEAQYAEAGYDFREEAAPGTDSEPAPLQPDVEVPAGGAEYWVIRVGRKGERWFFIRLTHDEREWRLVDDFSDASLFHFRDEAEKWARGISSKVDKGADVEVAEVLEADVRRWFKGKPTPAPAPDAEQPGPEGEAPAAEDGSWMVATEDEPRQYLTVLDADGSLWSADPSQAAVYVHRKFAETAALSFAEDDGPMSRLVVVPCAEPAAPAAEPEPPHRVYGQAMVQGKAVEDPRPPPEPEPQDAGTGPWVIATNDAAPPAYLFLLGGGDQRWSKDRRDATQYSVRKVAEADARRFKSHRPLAVVPARG